MTTLIFVRHGQSESNLARVFTGQGNTALTSLGREQAERTAQYLKQFPITHIYASDLCRTMETAAPTARELGLEIIPTQALREIYAGEWEGKPYETLRQMFGTSYQMWLEDLGHAHPEGGESALELYQRVNREIDRLIRAHKGECIAVFSHATPARAVACRWFGFAPEDMAKVPWATNASVSIAEYDDDGNAQVIQYGYDGHQGDVATSFPKGIV
jgi:broad specificity phosphatase PhoE